ncbi:fluoride efflux transporter CrcB [Bacillus sp. B15-48]|uniref:fluoride efflux transporter CrcB n=1 Tax=Bacillus sp. B15-48 TaxID=1548601 RepID=UPI00193EE92E|nr:fluoride efflux transporter CrcB [Bacillus sp. B15-48]MBM4761486.1 fluoride efflux transporter CrcB [Bacillus sp. B15-48]
MKIIMIGIGGFLGAISRYGMGEWLHTENGFPVGTLTVNLLGCFLLGWFLAFAKRKNLRTEITMLFGTGFLGSFTTFSTFSVETVYLIENGQFLFAFSYVAASMLAGILSAYIGFRSGSS